MSDRDMLSRINYQNGTIEIDGTVYPLRDTDFPTIDPADPNKLTPEEQDIIDGLVSSFRRSEKLQIHTRFLYSVGSIYRRHNGNLLYHGCIPCDGNGEFMEFSLYSDTPSRDGHFWTGRTGWRGRATSLPMAAWSGCAGWTFSGSSGAAGIPRFAAGQR